MFQKYEYEQLNTKGRLAGSRDPIDGRHDVIVGLPVSTSGHRFSPHADAFDDGTQADAAWSNNISKGIGSSIVCECNCILTSPSLLSSIIRRTALPQMFPSHGQATTKATVAYETAQSPYEISPPVRK